MTSANTFACAGVEWVLVRQSFLRSLVAPRRAGSCSPVRLCLSRASESGGPPSLLSGGRGGQAPPKPLLEDSVLALHACLALLMCAGSGKQRWAGESQVWLLCSMAL